jgi:ribosomal protein L7Ae-like RNA K-turn-binding protein
MSLQKQNGNVNGNVKKKSKKRKQYIPTSFLECQSLTHVLGFPPQSEVVTTPVTSDFVKELFLERFVKEIVTPFQPDKTKNRNNNNNGSNGTPTTIESNAGYYHVMVGGKLVKKRRISKDNNHQPKRTIPAPSEPLQPTDEHKIDARLARKKRIWKENIVIGTNQCLRLLENANANYCDDTTTTITPTTATAIKDVARTSTRTPSLIVVAKDIYPPTMCSAVPVLAKRLRIPLMLLPGKASLELGRALNNKRTSILIFCGDNGAAASVETNNNNNNNNSNDNSEATSDGGCHEKEISDARTAMASFVSFIRDQIPRNGV